MTDFAVEEFVTRLARTQQAMAEQELDAILLCTEAEIRYFSGFRTLFWQSPTRPWFMILPASGKPIALIPDIGVALMNSTWVEDIRSWSSPHPHDDGVSLLLDALSPFHRVGLPMGEEASLRMPLRDFYNVVRQRGTDFHDCSALLKGIRLIKSTAEIQLLEQICTIGAKAFARAPELFSAGMPLSEVFRAFRIALLEAGADDVPYLVGAAGQGGYADVISPPDGTALSMGDVLMLDTGATLHGYYCDFDRNFAIGHASDSAHQAYDRLWQATQAGIESARAGITCAELFHVIHNTLGGGTSDVGRYGHGLGIQLTEYPSIAPFDNTPLQPGMVMTIEPSLAIDDHTMMVHEENIVITEKAPRLLTQRAAQQIPVIM